jgi:altronate dehydratase small subunit
MISIVHQNVGSDKMSEMNFSALTGRKTALVLDQKDNVGVALTDLTKGDACTVIEDGGKEYQVTVTEDIMFGHKFALVDLKQDEGVYKYGEEIGKMKTAIAKGGWIHSHNMYCDRGMK